MLTLENLKSFVIDNVFVFIMKPSLKIISQGTAVGFALNRNKCGSTFLIQGLQVNQSNQCVVFNRGTKLTIISQTKRD